MRPYTAVVGLPIRGSKGLAAWDGLGLEAVGEPARDGLPEPLRFGSTTA